MAYSNINDENFKAITNFNVSIGLSEEEKKQLNLEYTRKNLLKKRYAGSGLDFPKRIPKYNEDKVLELSDRYFKTDTDDIQLEEELQRDFINSKNKDALQRKLALEEQKKIKEIKDLNDAGIVLPEGVNYFSEEGRAYIRSEASRHPKGFNEYIKDKVKAKEEQRIIEDEKRIAGALDSFIKKMIDEEFNASELNEKIDKVINELFEENVANLEPNIKETAKRQLEAEVRERIAKGKSGGAGVSGVLPRGSIFDSDLPEIPLNISEKVIKDLETSNITIQNRIYTNILGYTRLEKGLMALRSEGGVRIFDRYDNLLSGINLYKSPKTIKKFVDNYNPK